ncbi:hypothetical protein [Nitrosarchaeum sp. AC2]|uniref:hypothetical protein n=1 Tax=Nitrosarchaeum sp. AC2 TaxID=2259673 RepID=UPI0015CA746F|nr:hypothetical protein [Nitrosarchaeum sp. AC2]QLH11000.1 hypothetical protein DSQ20_05595 [Nitrosarchaeum sp. AC2]
MIKQLGVIFSILLAFIIFINPAFAIEPLDRVEITNPRLVNSFGSQISNQINVNQQIQITADVKNNQDKTQTFVYIVQVKNQNGVIITIGWISGLLNPGQTFSPALSWAPKISGEYTAEIYVWDVSEEGSTKSWQRLDALAEQVSLKITS